MAGVKVKESEGITPDLIRAIIKNVRKRDKDIGLLNDLDKVEVKDWVSTGNFLLDCLLGGRGLPFGRIVEILGEEGSGKTSLLLSILSQVQKRGGVACLIETEHAFARERAEMLGVDINNLVFAQKDCLEEVLELIESIISAIEDGQVVAIGWDSIAATPPREEIDSGYGDKKVGLHARIMSLALRKLPSQLMRKNVLLVCNNQLRCNIGVYPGVDPWESIGGKAMKYHSTIRMRLHPGSKIKEDDSGGAPVIGQIINVKVIKNKVAPPFRDAKIRFIFDKGFEEEESVLDYLKGKHIVIHQGGPTYVLKLPDNSISFTHKDWGKVLEQHKQDIKELIVKG